MLWDLLAQPWRCCLDEAWAAYRAGSIPIGAAIVDGSGAVVSTGRNRVFEPDLIPPFLGGHRLAHAEVNALVALDYARADPRECALYTTTEPCPLCIGAIRMARLREVCYAARDPVAGSTVLLDATPFMRRRDIRVHGPARADLETIVVALHVEFSLRTDGLVGKRLVAQWERDLAAGVRLGRKLYQSGELFRLGQAGIPTADLLQRLEAMLH